MTRDELLATGTKREVVSLVVPEWDGKTIYLRAMNGVERRIIEDAFAAERVGGGPVNPARGHALLAAMSICDEAGNLLFTPDDVDTLMGLSASAMQRVFVRAARLNRLRAADIEDMEKN